LAPQYLLCPSPYNGRTSRLSGVEPKMSVAPSRPAGGSALLVMIRRKGPGGRAGPPIRQGRMCPPSCANIEMFRSAIEAKLTWSGRNFKISQFFRIYKVLFFIFNKNLFSMAHSMCFFRHIF
jgi:hypothetical protein